MMVKTEEMRKILGKFPHGVKAQDLADKFKVGKTTVYELPNELLEYDLAYNKDGLWFSAQPKETALSSSLVVSGGTTWKEIERIKEDYVNRRIDKAYRRVRILRDANNSLPKAWVPEIRNTEDLLDEEFAAIKSDPFEGYNPDRQRRILEYEAVIVARALKHWLSDKHTR
jgi:hypothetical protein